MHSSLVLLFLISITLIIIMITCFICLNRSRKKEDKAFMEQVQFQTQAVARQQQQQQHHHHQQQHQMSACSPSPKLVQSPSNNNLMINDTITNGQLIYQQQQQQQQHQQQNQSSPGDPYSTASQVMVDYASQAATNTGRSPYTPSAANASPFHQSTNSASSPRGPTETRSDITQQINSAIIGSSEAEFQNDFIQVFPMYQIAPQPEKNTTPYLT